MGIAADGLRPTSAIGVDGLRPTSATGIVGGGIAAEERGPPLVVLGMCVGR